MIRESLGKRRLRRGGEQEPRRQKKTYCNSRLRGPTPEREKAGKNSNIKKGGGRPIREETVGEKRSQYQGQGNKREGLGRRTGRERSLLYLGNERLMGEGGGKGKDEASGNDGSDSGGEKTELFGERKSCAVQADVDR